MGRNFLFSWKVNYKALGVDVSIDFCSSSTIYTTELSIIWDSFPRTTVVWSRFTTFPQHGKRERKKIFLLLHFCLIYNLGIFVTDFIRFWQLVCYMQNHNTTYLCKSHSRSITKSSLEFIFVHTIRKVKFFFQKFNFDKTPTFSPKFFFDNFSREIKVVNS